MLLSKVTQKGQGRSSTDLYDLANSLNKFPDKYPICRHAIYKKYRLHCATFENIYVFVYKVIGKELVIYNVIHARRMK